VAATGNIYNGLWYPIMVAVMTTVIGGLLLRDTKDSRHQAGIGRRSIPTRLIICAARRRPISPSGRVVERSEVADAGCN
jgi:hypothetical protein